MAKITAPLLSVTARGSIRPRLTYSQRTSGAQVRIQRKQADKKTLTQVAQRLKFSTSILWWHLMTDDEQILFNDYTKGNQ